MTDRRPLGTGPTRAELPDESRLGAPRAQPAAERLTSGPAATDPPAPRPAGRRTLGSSPGATRH
ncbi:hypothetical protein [Streptomyces sp. 8L]|uniref:hypothetical protein n=1 Tax=Streptomyces sp. 8L TaxID=2877242 RepID=UPI001CD484AF|nr:hypothetical protein [Streptomyces sp. 8L]MCA1222187.1 hypothetical protein [Streptomyces sp. 8L]